MPRVTRRRAGQAAQRERLVAQAMSLLQQQQVGFRQVLRMRRRPIEQRVPRRQQELEAFEEQRGAVELVAGKRECREDRVEAAALQLLGQFGGAALLQPQFKPGNRSRSARSTSGR